MVIAVALKDDEASQIDQQFGRCSNFLLVNDTDGTRRILKNPYADTFGGAGIQTAQLLIENNVDVLIVKQVCNHGWKILNIAGIKVYDAEDNEVDDALTLFYEGTLAQFDPASLNAFRHGRWRQHRFRGGSQN